jgi:starch phosphorylase
MNGGLNLSILDGWWDEAYDPSIGFAIGKGEMYDDPQQADDIESRALYDLLERTILPEFYDRDERGLPRRWITRMKAALATVTPEFSASRMVADYAERYYVPAHDLSGRLTAQGMTGAIDFADHLRTFDAHWHEVEVTKVVTDAGPSVDVRSEVSVMATVKLGQLRPEDVRVEVYHGSVDAHGKLTGGECDTLTHVSNSEAEADGLYAFRGSFVAAQSGRQGFAVRVVPHDDRLVGTRLPGKITWYREAGQEAPGKSTTAAREAVA